MKNVIVAVIVGCLVGVIVMSGFVYQNTKAELSQLNESYVELQEEYNQTQAEYVQMRDIGCMYINFSITNYGLLADSSELLFGDYRTAIRYDTLASGARQHYFQYCEE